MLPTPRQLPVAAAISVAVAAAVGYRSFTPGFCRFLYWPHCSCCPFLLATAEVAGGRRRCPLPRRLRRLPAAAFAAAPPPTDVGSRRCRRLLPPLAAAANCPIAPAAARGCRRCRWLPPPPEAATSPCGCRRPSSAVGHHRRRPPDGYRRRRRPPVSCWGLPPPTHWLLLLPSVTVPLSPTPTATDAAARQLPPLLEAAAQRLPPTPRRLLRLPQPSPFCGIRVCHCLGLYHSGGSQE